MVWRRIEITWDEFNAIRAYSSEHDIYYSEVVQIALDKFFGTNRFEEIDKLDDTKRAPYIFKRDRLKEFILALLADNQVHPWSEIRSKIPTNYSIRTISSVIAKLFRDNLVLKIKKDGDRRKTYMKLVIKNDLQPTDH